MVAILRAKSAVYWPGCDDQIRNMVASCATCQEHRNHNPAQPLYPFPRVAGPRFLESVS